VPLAGVLALMFVAAAALPARGQEGTYQSARQAMEHGQTEEAIQEFCALGDYKDAAQYCRRLQAQLQEVSRRNETNYQNGVRAFQSGDYDAAQHYFEQVTGPRYEAAQEYLNTKIPAARKNGGQGGAASPPVKITQPIASIDFAADTSKKSAKTTKAVKPAALAAKAVSAPAVPVEAPAPPAPLATATLQPPDADAVLAGGLQAYYGGRFAEAESKLQQYLDGGGARRGVAEFYLGASKLTRYYLGGAKDQDAALLNDARAAFQSAHQVEGFILPEQYVSPKIAAAYKSSAP
jgi:TolA-binding protein